MLHQKIYISRAIRHFDDSELVELLKVSRKANALRSVTGILLYDDRVFIQLLEGQTSDVNIIMDKITTDKRHEGIVYLLNEHCPFGRLFPDWTMGFRHMKVLDKYSIDGLEVSGLSQTKAYIKSAPESLAGRLLLNIINSNQLRSV
jgi:hypothetical protein